MVMRKAIRWTVLGVASVVIALVLVFSGVLMETGDQGSSDLEVYIGEQIRSAVNDVLKPQLEFTKPDYQYPKTVTIENVRITASDPMRDGRSVDIIRIRRATLELSEIPSVGEPLRIERVTLDKPELRLVAMGTENASLIGFSDLLKKSSTSDTVEPATPSTTKLTDVFRIRFIQLVGGVIEYDPRSESGKAMRLDNISTTLEVEPTDDGWYELRTNIQREPILSIGIEGRFNINDAIAKIKSLNVKMELGEGANKTMPPQMQSFVQEHQLRGTLDMNVSGEINFNDMTKSTATLDADLRKGFATFEKYRLPIDKMLVKAKLVGESIEMNHFEIRALDGVIFATGKLSLTGEQEASLDFEAENLDLSKLDAALATSTPPSSETASPSAADDQSKSASESNKDADNDAAKDAKQKSSETKPASQPSPLRGKLNAKFALAAPLAAITTEAAGQGSVTLRDGRLVRVPILKQLEFAVAKATDVFSSGKPSDHLHVEFKLVGDHAKIDKIDLRTPAMAMRGQGTVHFDGKLDLSLNGGPLEKVQNLFGKLGEFTSLITDKLAKYRVTGTVEKPEFGITIAPGLFDGLTPKSNE